MNGDNTVWSLLVLHVGQVQMLVYVCFQIVLKACLGLFVSEQYYQVIPKDEFRLIFFNHAHHSLLSLLYSTIVLYALGLEYPNMIIFFLLTKFSSNK